MAEEGWYPDPDGSSGFRYWDGRRWTASPSPHPSPAPPGLPTADRSAPARTRRRGLGLLLGALALLILIAVVATVVVTRPGRSDTTGTSAPNSTISSYDDGRTDTPRASSSATPSTQPRPVACDQASIDQERTPPSDGRVHGGPLSFEQLPPAWSRPQPTSRVPYSRDSHVQTLNLPEELPWQASAQVGITIFTSFPGGAAATNAMLQCVLTSDFYTAVNVSLTKNTVTSTTVSGHRATQRDALLRFSHPELSTKGSRLRFVVVESDPITYYFSAVPMERSDLITQLDRATRSLEVS